MAGNSLRTCTKCGEEKEYTEFHLKKNSADGRSRTCKVCDYAKVKKSREKNPDRWLAISLKKYGLTVEEFRRMEKEQGGCCAVCGIKPDYRLCVDHRHDTGKVRGLLCRTCNKAIGQLGDTPEDLLKAYQYLLETH
jgi:formate dehydrogenase maturation protein FdhE